MHSLDEKYLQSLTFTAEQLTIYVGKYQGFYFKQSPGRDFSKLPSLNRVNRLTD